MPSEAPAQDFDLLMSRLAVMGTLREMGVDHKIPKHIQAALVAYFDVTAVPDSLLAIVCHNLIEQLQTLNFLLLKASLGNTAGEPPITYDDKGVPTVEFKNKSGIQVRCCR